MNSSPKESARRLTQLLLISLTDLGDIGPLFALLLSRGRLCLENFLMSEFALE
jgi:hypothetical protein